MADQRSLRQRPQASCALERCDSEDRFHDYVLAEYPPRASAVGKLRSMNVLVESFALAGIENEGLALVNHIRESFGRFRPKI